jgi:hypothetical protein
MSIKTVKALIVLESANGARLVSKYYSNEPSFVNKQRQEAFEAKLFAKTKSQPLAEIVILDEYAAVYKSSGDLTFFTIGNKDENELLLLQVLNVFRESMDVLLRNQVEKKTMLENLDYVLLTMDELVDSGIILEWDVDEIVKRVSLKTAFENETPIAEQTLSQAFETAKVQLIKSFIS